MLDKRNFNEQNNLFDIKGVFGLERLKNVFYRIIVLFSNKLINISQDTNTPKHSIITISNIYIKSVVAKEYMHKKK